MSALSSKPLRTALAGAVLALAPEAAGAAAFQVSNTNDAGAGSLRQALLDANTSAGQDVIQFAIAGPGPHTIAPLSPLPALTERVLIDGFSQAGASCGAWPPDLRIVLDGSNAGVGADGVRLTVGADLSTVRGLVIHSFAGHGIYVETPDEVNIRCNLIGTDATGTVALGNGEGVRLLGSVNSTVGGDLLPHRNLISGNATMGVRLASGCPQSEVVGNYIGTNAAGTAALPNQYGVYVQSDEVTIGGVGIGTGNLISGNTLTGIVLTSGASGTLVFSNRIGTDVDGEPVLGNGGGISLGAGAENSVIGTLLFDDLTNVIAGNTSHGINLFNGDDTIGNSIRGNAIFENGGLGIKISGTENVPTPNDPGDADDGPNRTQNHPELASAVWNGAESRVLIDYTVPTDPANATYPLTVDLYLADADEQEGALWLGSTTFSTDDVAAGGLATRVAIDFALEVGDALVATATDDAGNTSEFSAPIVVPAPAAGALGAASLASLAALARRRR